MADSSKDFVIPRAEFWAFLAQLRVADVAARWRLSDDLFAPNQLGLNRRLAVGDIEGWYRAYAAFLDESSHAHQLDGAGTALNARKFADLCLEIRGQLGRVTQAGGGTPWRGDASFRAAVDAYNLGVAGSREDPDDVLRDLVWLAFDPTQLIRELWSVAREVYGPKISEMPALPLNVDAALSALDRLVEFTQSQPMAPPMMPLRMPGGLEQLAIKRPSLVSDEEKATTWYRCRRLGALIDLHYYAMSWAVHRANEWQLGASAMPFVASNKILRLLGLETLRDLARENWKSIADSCGFATTTEPQKAGIVWVTKLQLADDGTLLPVQSDGNTFRTARPPEFVMSEEGVIELRRPVPDPVEQPLTLRGDELVTRVEFRDDVEAIPWAAINSAIRSANTNAWQALKELGIKLDDRLWFEQLHDGPELLRHIAVRGLDPAKVLLDLEARRRELNALIEPVLRDDVQSGELPTTVPPLSERARLVLKVLLEAGAFDSDHRVTTAQVAARATGKGSDPAQFKMVIADLKTTNQYVDTRQGRSGGCWLTESGRVRAAKL